MPGPSYCPRDVLSGHRSLALGRIAAVAGNGTSYYHLPDSLGSTMATVDGSGGVTDTYDYDVFGNTRSETGSQSNEFKFDGEQFDPGGFTYLRARYYDPETGRFLSRDPLPGIPGLPGSQNRYPYALGNPTNWTDPSGLCAWRVPCPGVIKDAGKAVGNVAEEGWESAVQTFGPPVLCSEGPYDP